MDSIALIMGVTHPHIVATYRLVSLLVSVLCAMEAIRVVFMVALMIREKLTSKEPVIFNCLIIASALMIMLAARSYLQAVTQHHASEVCACSVLNVVPVLLFIYLLRMAGKLLWLEDVCVRYGIKNYGICKRSKR